jgi:hypothetical protein
LKIKFHLNENIGRHGKHLELNLNLIQLDLGFKQDKVDTKSECLSFTFHHAYKTKKVGSNKWILNLLLQPTFKNMYDFYISKTTRVKQLQIVLIT